MRIDLSADRIIELPQSQSTNDDAFQALDTHSSCLIWTRDQPKGRGSRGRSWLAPPGHALALSIGLSGQVAPKPDRFCYPLFAGVLLHRVLSAAAPDGQFALKWPNDLLLNGKKLAGILCESRWSRSQMHIVIGIGVNLKHHPALDDLPKGFATLEELQTPPSASSIVHQLAANLDGDLAELESQQVLHRQWLFRSAHRVGAKLHIKAYGKDMRGVFKGLDEDGGLLIEDQHGKTETIRQSCDDFVILQDTEPITQMEDP